MSVQNHDGKELMVGMLLPTIGTFTAETKKLPYRVGGQESLHLN
jgi:hypothetical protein